jgi:two-component system phosphate regulon sensor histidine kinase PhoR
MIPFMIWNRQPQPPDEGDARADNAAGDRVLQPQIAGLPGALIEAIPDPFIIVDEAGLIVAANQATMQLFKSLMPGDHLSQHARTPLLLETIEEVIDTQVARRIDYERRTGGGRRFEAWIAPLEVAGNTGSAPARKGPAASILLRDLTAQQNLERMRTDFVANASHELRTPLASMTGYIETLQGSARTDEVARERFLGRMLEQAHRMRRLIDDLLSLSRVEMNVHRTPSDIVDLADIARFAAEALGIQARAEGCAIRVSANGPAAVKGDREELIQVVQNLIENALKYGSSAQGIDVTVKVDAARNHIHLAVRDHGNGIPAEHLPRRTERFYRVNAQESRSRGGTGLGLSIVKHILLRHQADLAIESVPGQGSTFTIRFPAVAQVRKAAE